ncbi:hypothetical protein BN961_02490 [Afipia felis]|uniref:SirA-like protein n=1 Tax=Afipia felis TaxID=1035 RepID=A0A090MTV9_AFIFE|nr:hypothetical protein [Afipia felis]CEG09069.1 hypothetical protein BN961_02490 [Afipia felis]
MNEPLIADVEWDAGDLGCGPLLLELRNRLRTMPGQVFKLISVDPGSPEDLPVWCRLSRNELGQAREVTPQKMVFDWISGVRMDRLLLADEKVFSGLASAGDQWTSGARTIRLAEVNAEAGTASRTARSFSIARSVR